MVELQVLPERLGRVVEVLGPGHLPDVEGGQLAGVATQRVGEFSGGGEPVGVPGAAGESSLGEAGNGDAVPLQSLGGVHRHDLYRARMDCGTGDLQPAFAFLRSLQKGQEPVEAGGGGGRAVAGGLFNERVEPFGVALVHDHLDVQSGCPRDVGDQVADRLIGA
nr:hypothetical protein [Stackebrandtia endophytica]